MEPSTYQPIQKPVVDPTDKTKEEKAKDSVAKPIGDDDNQGNSVNEPPKPDAQK
jgi:hypothetical protein